MPLPTEPAGTSDEIRQRYLKLYSGAIADMLDKNGYRRQVLPHYVTPYTSVNRLAGSAFTGQGYPCACATNDDTRTRLDMLDSITPGTVSVWACGGSMECAHWGEIMSTAARERGCTGAVIDGGVRDLDFINVMQYPVFARFKSPASSIGRWDIKEYQVTVKIGETVVHPGDFVFGDIDGVVIVPGDLTLDPGRRRKCLRTREWDAGGIVPRSVHQGGVFQIRIALNPQAFTRTNVLVRPPRLEITAASPCAGPEMPWKRGKEG